MSFSVSALPYHGSLLVTSLLSSRQTLLLSSFGTLTSAVPLIDTNGKLSLGETISLGGQPFTVLGSGTAQPGIDILGLTIPTGTAKDMILLKDAAGHLTFVFPYGTPNATGIIALVVDLDPIGYSMPAQAPLCLLAGTRVRTPEGVMPVEALRVGMEVLTEAGPKPILWIGEERIAAGDAGERDLPILVPVGHFGPDRPAVPLRVSPQHRVRVDLVAGGQVLVAAKHLCAPQICPVRVCASRSAGRCDPAQGGAFPGVIVYFCLLLASHALIEAEGVAVESLLLGPAVLTRFPFLRGLAPGAVQPCHPILTPGGAKSKRRAKRALP